MAQCQRMEDFRKASSLTDKRRFRPEPEPYIAIIGPVAHARPRKTDTRVGREQIPPSAMWFMFAAMLEDPHFRRRDSVRSRRYSSFSGASRTAALSTASASAQ